MAGRDDAASGRRVSRNIHVLHDNGQLDMSHVTVLSSDNQLQIINIGLVTEIHYVSLVQNVQGQSG